MHMPTRSASWRGGRAKVPRREAGSVRRWAAPAAPKRRRAAGRSPHVQGGEEVRTAEEARGRGDEPLSEQSNSRPTLLRTVNVKNVSNINNIINIDKINSINDINYINNDKSSNHGSAGVTTEQTFMRSADGAWRASTKLIMSRESRLKRTQPHPDRGSRT